MERLDNRKSDSRHTSVSAHVAPHEKETIRAAARKTGARSLSSYVADRAFAAALEDLRSESSGQREEGDGGDD